MSEVDDLIGKLVEVKPELSREEIQEQIRQKKEKIGAGYLTDQGALFLIASDHGIDLSEPVRTEMEIKDLYAGAKEVSLEVRVLNMSPAKQFSRKDGTPFLLRTMTVYDSTGNASVKLWDDKANLPGVEQLKPGDLVRIIKAYIKSDIDGSPTVNVGSGSAIEPTDSESQISSIESLVKDVSELADGQKNVVVSGTVEGFISTMEFTNKRGQPSKALKMRLKGKDNSTMRVVLWGKDEEDIPNIISRDAKAKLLGVRVKAANQGLEIHGNDATIVDVEGQKEAGPVIVRILSVNRTENGRNMILGADRNGDLFNITDSSDSTSSCGEGDVMECMPSRMYGSSITLDENSFVRKLEDDGAIPTLEKVRTDVKDVKMDQNCCVEGIVLKTDRRDIQTKSGESIALSEMFMEDKTGQIWVKGWRNQARLLDTCELGEVVSISGLNARAGMEGKTELVLTPFSRIKKKG